MAVDYFVEQRDGRWVVSMHRLQIASYLSQDAAKRVAVLAARATFDALPMMRRAEAVRLVSVDGSLAEPVRQFTPADEAAAALARHGAPVEAHFARGAADVVAELRTQALDFGADILVMGCYGHSRLRQQILGGVTRTMLSDPPLPLFLSR